MKQLSLGQRLIDAVHAYERGEAWEPSEEDLGGRVLDQPCFYSLGFGMCRTPLASGEVCDLPLDERGSCGGESQHAPK